MSTAFRSATWVAGTLTVTFNTSYVETYSAPKVADAKRILHGLVMQYEEAKAETAMEEAAERFWEEGPVSFQLARLAEQDYEDRRLGVR